MEAEPEKEFMRRIVDDQEDRKNFVSRLGKLAQGSGTAIYARALMRLSRNLRSLWRRPRGKSELLLRRWDYLPEP